MPISMPPRIKLLAVAALMSSGLATAKPLPSNVASCAACHGANGLGNAAAGYPALAGLSAAYIDQQLFSFKHGTRKNPIMKGLATPLNPVQREEIARYYAAMRIPPKPEPKPLPAGSGELLAVNGDWNGATTGIPSCDACHGPDGIGVGQMFPRLAGQSQAYLAGQLVDWQKGSRNNDPLHLMRNIARRLTSAQIKAVTTYYAALPANPIRLPKPGSARSSK